MTTPGEPDIVERALVWGFPKPGPTLRLAYRELDQAVNGTAKQKNALGDFSKLARPWLPSTLTKADQRTDLWEWLDHVVSWLNHEYVFDTRDLIPSCWPRHPHLVHEIAVIADQRYAAEASLTSNALEDWHRYALPAFLERMRARLVQHCDDHHSKWPSHGRFHLHHDQDHVRERRAAYIGDARATTAESAHPPLPAADSSATPALHLVEDDSDD